VWDLSPAELRSVLEGAAKARTWVYEVALFTAWHTATFASLAFQGKLDSWESYRRKVSGAPAPAVPVSWQARKAERAAQMALFKKHQAARTAPHRGRRG
jgi:hypothetical protein